MEFYPAPNPKPDDPGKFQFPTGWNSTVRFLEVCDGIYLFQFPTGWNSTLVKDEKGNPQEMFQFPTGWNSTFPSYRTAYQFVVSIPNGMEFYFKFSMPGYGWNLFQFPTGWNSTPRTCKAWKNLYCFNSQRDGILRKKSKSRYPIPGVSIPNGMEFYATSLSPYAYKQ